MCDKTDCAYAHIVFCNACLLKNHYEEQCPQKAKETNSESDDQATALLLRAIGQTARPRVKGIDDEGLENDLFMNVVITNGLSLIHI